MMSKARASFLIAIWVFVAVIAVVVILQAPKPITSEAPEQTWQTQVEWMPSRLPAHSMYAPQEALYPALDEGYLAHLEAKYYETELYGPPYLLKDFPKELPVDQQEKPILVVPGPIQVEQGEGGAAPNEVRIAIIIDDMGMGNSTRAVADLPAEVTLSFLPYAPDLQNQVRQVLARGHEVLLHLPMEPLGYENPGPGALLTDLSLEELSVRLSKALTSFEGYVGVNNHMGSKFTKYREGMEFVLEVLHEKGLFFIDSLTTGSSVAGSLAKQVGVRTATRDVFLDDEIEVDAIKTQLLYAEHVARKKGTALVICHPHNLTLSLLSKWLEETDKRRIRIVPASELLQ